MADALDLGSSAQKVWGFESPLSHDILINNQELVLDVNIIDKSNWEKTVEVSIPYNDLIEDFEKKYKDYKKNIKLEGFRKGKVPVTLIKQMFGKEIEAQVAEEKISVILEDISKDNKFVPISPARVEEFNFDVDTGLKFKALIEIVPSIEIEKYKAFDLEKEIYQLDDEDVDEAISSIRQQHAVMENVEDPVEVGHYLVADFQKLDDSGVPLIGEKFEDRYFQLTADSEDEGNNLSSQLVGAKIEETRRITLTNKDQDQNEITDNFSVTIKEIKKQVLPELDDEFARDLGDFENLEALKKGVREDLEKRTKNEYDKKFEETIINEVVKANEIEVPEPMIKNYLDSLIENVKKNSQQQVDEANLRNEYRGEAIRRIKWMLINDKIVELEKLEVSNEDVDNRITEMLEGIKQNAAQYKSYYNRPENRDRMKSELLDKKVFQFIADNSTVKEKKISRKDLQKDSKIIV